MKPGSKVLIRTVTNYWVGEVVEVYSLAGCVFVDLTRASWVADTGRFSTAVKSGVLSEVEFVGGASVALGAVVDIVPWPHPLPTVTR